MEITLPYQFQPRKYQIPLLRYLDNGGKRALCVWHRRAGKDIALWNYLIKRAFQEKGLYFYFLPEYTQARKILWDGINNSGFKFLDYCPDLICLSKNSVEMKIELTNGSIVQLIGTDRYDTIRGTNPIGCVFSEYAFQNPMAWEVVKPILRVNGGWAVFNSTPNGKNHFYDLYEMARNNEEWFCEKLTIKDTKVLSDSDIDSERREGMSEEMIQQEYYVSFDIGALGAYYAKQIQDMNVRGGVCSIPIDSARDVDLFLDLGKNDATSIGFLQTVGKEYRIIDFYEGTGQDIEHYAKTLKERNYRYRFMYLPHDAFSKRLESPKTIAEQFEGYGFKVKRVPKLDINAGIQRVRKVFPQLWVDKDRCKQLIRALENYHHEYDEVKKVFKDQPLHDWSSHACDMIRYMAVGLDESLPITITSYRSSATEYVGQSGIINPLIHKNYNTDQYIGKVENYLNS